MHPLDAPPRCTLPGCTSLDASAGCSPPPRCTPPLDVPLLQWMHLPVDVQIPSPEERQSIGGRYASYWNAYLFIYFYLCQSLHAQVTPDDFRPLVRVPSIGTFSREHWKCAFTGQSSFSSWTLFCQIWQYRFVLQNVKTKYYPTPSGKKTQAPWL